MKNQADDRYDAGTKKGCWRPDTFKRRESSNL